MQQHARRSGPRLHQSVHEAFRQPHYDAIFGKLCRWLSERDLEMHTPMKGEPRIVRRPEWKPRHPYAREVPTPLRGD